MISFYNSYSCYDNPDVFWHMYKVLITGKMRMSMSVKGNWKMLKRSVFLNEFSNFFFVCLCVCLDPDGPHQAVFGVSGDFYCFTVRPAVFLELLY